MTLQQIPMASVFHRLNIIINNNNNVRGVRMEIREKPKIHLKKSLRENQTEKRSNLMRCVNKQTLFTFYLPHDRTKRRYISRFS